MNRRGFISLLGGASTAWPVAAEAQQPLPVVGYFDATNTDLDPTAAEPQAVCREVPPWRIPLDP
jgi:hypothetical protein